MENLSTMVWRSSVYAMNLAGPRTDPCVTPQVSSVVYDRPVDALTQ